MDTKLLHKRARIVRTIRAFFDGRGYLAAETPQLATKPIPEAHLELFSTTLLSQNQEPVHGESESLLFLLPSPEYYLKQLLAAGTGSLYEITHSFRNAEVRSPHHNPEFTMLEYYTVDADADDSLALTVELLEELPEGTTRSSPTPLVIPMQEAWKRWTGMDLASTLAGTEAQNRAALVQEIEKSDLLTRANPQETWEDLFQRVFLTHVEPQLPNDRPVFITRYPAAIPTLARTIPGTPWADRWELYLSGLEVANCFGEETDPARIRKFMERQAAEKRKTGHREHCWNSDFLQPPATLPRCSGVAMGVDRLVMHILGKESVNRVISFPDFW